MDYLTRIFRIPEFISIMKDQLTFRQLIKMQRINRSICWIINDQIPKILIWKITDDYDKLFEETTYGIQIYAFKQNDRELIHQKYYNASESTKRCCMVEKIFQKNTLYHIDSKDGQRS